jgi:glycosyltransferase involved in cell wall biosynthesis
LEEVKGAADTVQILSLLPNEFFLEILGDGPEREKLIRAVQDRQLGDRVKFRGWVDSVTRDRVLASAGALLMPSLCAEAFGMAGLEALAQGTPVVAYDVGGISEWCRGQAGILVQCGDVRRAAMAVRELTQDSVAWANHSRAAKCAADRGFPVNRFEQDLDQLLQQVLQSV